MSSQSIQKSSTADVSSTVISRVESFPSQSLLRLCLSWNVQLNPWTVCIWFLYMADYSEYCRCHFYPWCHFPLKIPACEHERYWEVNHSAFLLILTFECGSRILCGLPQLLVLSFSYTLCFPSLHPIMQPSRDLTSSSLKNIGEDSVKNLLSSHIDCISWITLMHVLVDCFRKVQEFKGGTSLYTIWLFPSRLCLSRCPLIPAVVILYFSWYRHQNYRPVVPQNMF